MENHQINKIYESSLQSKNLINRYRSDIVIDDFTVVNAVKKIFTKETEWEVMEQNFISDLNIRYYRGNFYKNYHITILKIPEKIIPFIKYTVLVKDTTVDIFDSSPRSAFFLISSSDGNEDNKIKTLDIYIPFFLGSHAENESQVYSKLIIKIYNPYYFE